MYLGSKEKRKKPKKKVQLYEEEAVKERIARYGPKYLTGQSPEDIEYARVMRERLLPRPLAKPDSERIASHSEKYRNQSAAFGKPIPGYKMKGSTHNVREESFVDVFYRDAAVRGNIQYLMGKKADKEMKKYEEGVSDWGFLDPSNLSPEKKEVALNIVRDWVNRRQEIRALEERERRGETPLYERGKLEEYKRQDNELKARLKAMQHAFLFPWEHTSAAMYGWRAGIATPRSGMPGLENLDIDKIFEGDFSGMSADDVLVAYRYMRFMLQFAEDKKKFAENYVEAQELPGQPVAPQIRTYERKKVEAPPIQEPLRTPPVEEKVPPALPEKPAAVPQPVRKTRAASSAPVAIAEKKERRKVKSDAVKKARNAGKNAVAAHVKTAERVRQEALEAERVREAQERERAVVQKQLERERMIADLRRENIPKYLKFKAEQEAAEKLAEAERAAKEEMAAYDLQLERYQKYVQAMLDEAKTAAAKEAVQEEVQVIRSVTSNLRNKKAESVNNLKQKRAAIQTVAKEQVAQVDQWSKQREATPTTFLQMKGQATPEQIRDWREAVDVMSKAMNGDYARMDERERARQEKLKEEQRRLDILAKERFEDEAIFRTLDELNRAEEEAAAKKREKKLNSDKAIYRSMTSGERMLRKAISYGTPTLRAQPIYIPEPTPTPKPTPKPTPTRKSASVSIYDLVSAPLIVPERPKVPEPRPAPKLPNIPVPPPPEKAPMPSKRPEEVRQARKEQRLVELSAKQESTMKKVGEDAISIGSKLLSMTRTAASKTKAAVSQIQAGGYTVLQDAFSKLEDMADALDNVIEEAREKSVEEAEKLEDKEAEERFHAEEQAAAEAAAAREAAKKAEEEARVEREAREAAERERVERERAEAERKRAEAEAAQKAVDKEARRVAQEKRAATLRAVAESNRKRREAEERAAAEAAQAKKEEAPAVPIVTEPPPVPPETETPVVTEPVVEPPKKQEEVILISERAEKKKRREEELAKMQENKKDKADKSAFKELQETYQAFSSAVGIGLAGLAKVGEMASDAIAEQNDRKIEEAQTMVNNIEAAAAEARGLEEQASSSGDNAQRLQAAIIHNSAELNLLAARDMAKKIVDAANQETKAAVETAQEVAQMSIHTASELEAGGKEAMKYKAPEVGEEELEAVMEDVQRLEEENLSARYEALTMGMTDVSRIEGRLDQLFGMVSSLMQQSVNQGTGPIQVSTGGPAPPPEDPEARKQRQKTEEALKYGEEQLRTLQHEYRRQEVGKKFYGEWKDLFNEAVAAWKEGPGAIKAVAEKHFPHAVEALTTMRELGRRPPAEWSTEDFARVRDLSTEAGKEFIGPFQFRDPKTDRIMTDVGTSKFTTRAVMDKAFETLGKTDYKLTVRAQIAKDEFFRRGIASSPVSLSTAIQEGLQDPTKRLTDITLDPLVFRDKKYEKPRPENWSALTEVEKYDYLRKGAQGPEAANAAFEDLRAALEQEEALRARIGGIRGDSEGKLSKEDRATLKEWEEARSRATVFSDSLSHSYLKYHIKRNPDAARLARREARAAFRKRLEEQEKNRKEISEKMKKKDEELAKLGLPPVSSSSSGSNSQDILDIKNMIQSFISSQGRSRMGDDAYFGRNKERSEGRRKYYDRKLRDTGVVREHARFMLEGVEGRKKWAADPAPWESERSRREIQAPGGFKKNEVGRAIARSDVGYDTERELKSAFTYGLPGGNGAQSIIDDIAQGAIYELGRKAVGDLEKKVDEQFAHDFRVWLTGKPSIVSDNEAIRSVHPSNGGVYDQTEHQLAADFAAEQLIGGEAIPRRHLAKLPGVVEYLDTFVDKRRRFEDMLTKIILRKPKNIDEAFLYYKYIIRGNIATEDEINALYASNSFKNWSAE